jgi:hypothetical protein
MPAGRRSVKKRGAASAELDDQLALGTTRHIGAGDGRGGEELPERGDRTLARRTRVRFPPEPFTFLSVFGARPELHRIASFSRRTSRSRTAARLLWPRERRGRQHSANPDQRIGPAVQRKAVRTFSSKRHSTAKSRRNGASGGMSVLNPSTRAIIVVKVVAAASLLVISIVALGYARRMTSAQRSARPMAGMPQPAARRQRAASMRAATPCRKHRMPPILLGSGANFKPDPAPCEFAGCYRSRFGERTGGRAN